jgi:hypothetical protein
MPPVKSSAVVVGILPAWRRCHGAFGLNYLGSRNGGRVGVSLRYFERWRPARNPASNRAWFDPARMPWLKCGSRSSLDRMAR